MKLSPLTSALFAACLIAPPLTSLAQGVRVGNGSDSLVHSSKNIRDNDTIMVIPDMDESLAVLRVVGDPGRGQPNTYEIFGCEQNPEGGPNRASCAYHGNIPLNQTADIVPGYYVINYAGSTFHLVAKASDRIEIKLTKLYAPDRTTSAGLSIGFARDADHPIEQDKIMREFFGSALLPIRDLYGGATSWRPHMTNYLRALLSNQDKACEKGSAYARTYSTQMTVIEPHAGLQALCDNRKSYRGLKGFSDFSSAPFIVEFIPYAIVVEGFFVISNGDKVILPTEITSDKVTAGQFISVLPGVYKMGYTRGGGEMSFKPGLVVSDRSQLSAVTDETASRAPAPVAASAPSAPAAKPVGACKSAHVWRTENNNRCESDYWSGCDRTTAKRCEVIQ
jgi:hypothetical protein